MSIRPRAGRRHVAPRRILAALLTLAALLAGCGGGGGAELGARVEPPASVATPASGVTSTAPAPVTTSPPEWLSYVATAKVPMLQVFDAPDAPEPSRELPNPWVVDQDYPDQTVPQVFLMKQRGPAGWVEVLLPVRPNGSTGWVRASDVTITRNPFHIRVELGAHRITVMREQEVLYEGRTAVGKPSTPTPTGEYYLRVLIQAVDPNTVYGPYAYGLSSHSEVLETFAGGDAEIGIHGNNDASVLGSDVTAGCIRIDNDAITTLSRQLPLGTPVNVVA